MRGKERRTTRITRRRRRKRQDLTPMANAMDIVYDLMVLMPHIKEGIPLDAVIEEICCRGRLPECVAIEAIDTWAAFGAMRIEKDMLSIAVFFPIFGYHF